MHWEDKLRLKMMDMDDLMKGKIKEIEKFMPDLENIIHNGIYPLNSYGYTTRVPSKSGETYAEMSSYKNGPTDITHGKTDNFKYVAIRWKARYENRWDTKTKSDHSQIYLLIKKDNEDKILGLDTLRYALFRDIYDKAFNDYSKAFKEGKEIEHYDEVAKRKIDDPDYFLVKALENDRIKISLLDNHGKTTAETILNLGDLYNGVNVGKRRAYEHYKFL